MVFFFCDNGTEIYVPFIYTLIKESNMLLEYYCVQKLITVDSDIALLKSIRYKFLDSKPNG
ncbi:hypothetical protein HZS_5149 [Henneguya salminicola]|nr:hypothetical protein HZS_5149 [Henneguya salminicola]